ncbi:hypothetical protein LMG31506_02440 [Cupriavidus yeoncheonensis]|uniref:Uncharacterized protein n=1 Tax=Cupriavidus yeoncheonensis TaxID=1462994 RepID=A0A916ITD8_9BURK|nr:hypothetical protein [Cupriavidus yeoncheonensis]CAG2140973.1 hypothetical protein LMG31506_02440 [Cupriavidus yeoncheonensis]
MSANTSYESRNDRAARRGRPGGGRSVAEFCADFGFSKQHYYVMRAQGLTPDELRLGNRVILTDTAIAAWERRMLAAAEAAK